MQGFCHFIICFYGMNFTKMTSDVFIFQTVLTLLVNAKEKNS